MNARSRKSVLINLTWAFVGVVGLVVFYALSIGPVTALWLTAGESDNEFVSDTLDAVYFPLGLLATRSQAVGAALEWYLEFWTGEDLMLDGAPDAESGTPHGERRRII